MRWIILLLLLVSCEKEILITKTIYVDKVEHPGHLEVINDYVSGVFMITTNDDWHIQDTVVRPMFFELHDTMQFTLDEADYRLQLKFSNTHYYSSRITVYADSTVYRTISAFGE